MTELSFAQTFLSALDTLPTKIWPDHVEDPRTYPRRPVFNLPKHTKPPPKKRRINSGSSRGLTVHLKSYRNPPLDFTLYSQAPTTSILDIKDAVSSMVKIPTEKIRLLCNKKPVAATKALKDLLVSGDGKGEEPKTDAEVIELVVMILGAGVATKLDIAEVSAPLGSDHQKLGEERGLLANENFWNDLRDFLINRLKDKVEGEKIYNIFRAAVK